MTPSFQLTYPLTDAAPVVLDSPHSGTRYPDDFGHDLDLAQLRPAEDTYVDHLFGVGPALGMSLLAAEFPRTYIDVNRALDDVDPLLMADQWPGPLSTDGKSRLGKGLVWRLLDDGTPIYRRRLSTSEVQGRIDRCWRPYHMALKTLLDQTADAHGGVLHLNCHSMPSVAAQLATDEPGLVHPDIVLGDRDGTSADPELTRLLADAFQRLGYACWVNRPYKGVELVRAYANPSRERHSIQLEVNRALYMDEQSLALKPRYHTLKDDLHRVLCVAREAMRERLSARVAA